MAASITGSLGDAKLLGRWVTVGITSSANGSCVPAPIGSAIRYNVAFSGTDLRVINLAIPRTATAGSWVCAKQEIQLSSNPNDTLTSPTAYRQILPAPTAATPVNPVPLSQALAAAATAQRTLTALLQAPARDQAALRAALLAAQNAQADLQGAVGNANAGNADPGQVAPPAPAEVAQAQQQLEQIAQQVADAGAQVAAVAPAATDAAAAGGAGAAGDAGAGGAAVEGAAASRAAAAAAAAGVDLAVTPLVSGDGQGTGASSKLSMSVSASPKVNRGRFITMKAVIAPKSSAGRVRIALVRFNAKGQPIASKAIYAPVKKGVATKRWRVPTAYTPSDFTLVVTYVPKRKGAPGVTGTAPVQIG